jgi:hypothetical protein
MTYAEMILSIRGYEKRQEREWERTRIIAYQVYVGTPKKGQNKPIQSYMPLPSDRLRVRKVDPSTREHFRQMAVKMNEKRNLN